MSSTPIPPAFKKLTPFIRRAEELDQDNSRGECKLVAYYCRQFAMQLGIKLRESTDDAAATTYLLALMDRLEEDKSTMPVFSNEEGLQICTEFATDVFSRADNEDRAGRADKMTAKTFYAAMSFYEILAQFQELAPELMEKKRYCKYKAADILKALKEGRVPSPGGPDEDVATEAGVEAMAEDNVALNQLQDAIPSAPTGLPTPTPATPSLQVVPPTLPQDAFPSLAGMTVAFPPTTDPVSYESVEPETSPYYPAPVDHFQAPVRASAPPMSAATSRTNGHRQEEIDDAIECAKFAIAALQVRDMGLAMDRLEKAMQCIR